ncbi:hypothetical protein AMTR_s00022p00226080 [Amborella trichopoda]|uniref:Uncharacterized protein n=1 Tax=Amborella trichopoda TaxID=13333 RepID=W1PWI3_AMBTC|nr:hypothetical protein AMTR_s00022p00226080 [Amborella trichopoda]
MQVRLGSVLSIVVSSANMAHEFLKTHVLSPLLRDLSLWSPGTMNEADEFRNVFKEVAELTGTFNLAEFISFCKNLDLQGTAKRCKEVHQRFDYMIERILKQHEEKNDHLDGPQDLVDILLKISQDDKAEMKLTRDDIKAFILVGITYAIFFPFIVPFPKLANLGIGVGLEWLAVAINLKVLFLLLNFPRKKLAN